jgi:uncharacterized membrane protein
LLQERHFGVKYATLAKLKRRKIMSEQPVNPELTSDDKLWAALSYVFAPLVGIIALLMEDKKARPYIKFHAVQSIVASIAFVVVAIIISVVTLGFGGLCVPLLWLVFLYWAYQAYQGQNVKIPVLSDFIKNQGWA